MVKFPVKISHGALIRMIDEAGNPVPLGSTASLPATGGVFPVGYDGEAFVESLSPHNNIIVESPNGKRCTVAFDYKPVAGDIPTIGPLHCLEKKP